MSAVGTRERLQSLDVLRGIAIVLVLSHHLQRCPPTVSPIVRAVFDVAHLGGWIGVDLFFVLSGFLVSGLIFREHVARGSFQPARFLIRRGFKIYPAFYVLLLVTLFDLEDRINISTANLWGEVFFLQNYLGAIWNHTWSLAVEEHFYLLLSALLFAWSRRRATNPFAGLVWLTPLVMFVTLALRLASCIRGHAPYQTHWATHFRVDSLLFGVLLSWLFHYQPEALRARVAERRGALLAVSLAMLSTAFWIGPTDESFFINTVGYDVLTLGAGGLLLVMVHSAPRRGIVGLLFKALAAIGFYSYSIYLWHMAVYRLIAPRFAAHLHSTSGFLSYALLGMLGCVLLGYLTAKLVEMPFLHLRDRYFTSKAL